MTTDLPSRNVMNAEDHNSRALRPAFSLVELIVVIGIITVLIGLLLPVLSRARAAARSTACASNLRQAGALGAAWIVEHDGYLPLAGLAAIRASPTTLGSLPGQLQDADRSRYPYARQSIFAPRPEELMPLPAALADEGDATIFSCPDALPEATESSRVGWQIFRPADGVIVQQSGGSSNAWDYGSNVGIVGFDIDEMRGRARGLLSRVRDGSQVALMVGLDRSAFPPNVGWPAWWEPVAGEVDRAVTMRDALERTSRVTSVARLDPNRHGGRAGVLFADGHAEMVPVTPEALERVVLRWP